MKKLLTLALALMLVLSLVACGGKTDPAPSGSNNPGTQQTDPGTTQQEPSNNTDGGDKDTVKSNWENAQVEERFVEDFDKLSSGIPEPESTYSINGISLATGLMFDFESEAEAETWKQTLLDNGFTLLEEKFGTYTYENGTHTVRFSGYSITIKIK